MKITLLAALVGLGSTTTIIAGYTSKSDVGDHTNIDLDQEQIENQLPDYAAATATYQNGGNSGSGPQFRTIQGFSLTDPADKLVGEREFDKGVAYYGDLAYGNMWVMGALDGTNVVYTNTPNGDAAFGSINDDATRIQATKKGTVYLNIWIYSLHEFEAAIAKCEDPPTTEVNGLKDNYKSYHAWDEGVAFYTGSLEGNEGLGSGKLMYALAEKRCSDFMTCGAKGDQNSGNAKVNIDVFADFDAGKAAIEAGQCTKLRGYTNEITAKGTVPMIQGALKYAWYAPEGLKQKAEAATFAAGILGRLNDCSSSAAKIVYDNLKIGASTTSFSAVKTALESQYNCMGIRCEDVGGLYDGSTGEYLFMPCVTLIAGYHPPTSVVSHNSIDLNQAAMESKLGEDPMDYTGAKAIYNDVGVTYSLSPTRTIAGFSTSAETKLKGEPEYDKQYAYYGNYDFGNMWIMGALDGTAVEFAKNGNADFSAVSDGATRLQAIKKGTVYLNIWLYALHEFEAGLSKCSISSNDLNEDAVHAWDEGVAFYTGSLEGRDGLGGGKLMYALADKRGKEFKTCGFKGNSTAGTSRVNLNIIASANAGKVALESNDCVIRGHIDDITAQGFVPLVQGLLKYSYFVGEEGSGLKQQAEQATFAAGLLGRLNDCSSSAAKIVYDNCKIGATKTDFPAVKAAVEAQYTCMGITCEDVGAYYKIDTGYKWSPCSSSGGGGGSSSGGGGGGGDTPLPSTSNNDDAPGWAIAVMATLGSLLGLVLVGGAFMMAKGGAGGAGGGARGDSKV